MTGNYVQAEFTPELDYSFVRRLQDNDANGGNAKTSLKCEDERV